VPTVPTRVVLGTAVPIHPQRPSHAAVLATGVVLLRRRVRRYVSILSYCTGDGRYKQTK
jgi:hypothetical protein